jgi:hypothetical protein
MIVLAIVQVCTKADTIIQRRSGTFFLFNLQAPAPICGQLFSSRHRHLWVFKEIMNSHLLGDVTQMFF